MKYKAGYEFPLPTAFLSLTTLTSLYLKETLLYQNCGWFTPHRDRCQDHRHMHSNSAYSSFFLFFFKIPSFLGSSGSQDGSLPTKDWSTSILAGTPGHWTWLSTWHLSPLSVQIYSRWCQPLTSCSVNIRWPAAAKLPFLNLSSSTSITLTLPRLCLSSLFVYLKWRQDILLRPHW